MNLGKLTWTVPGYYSCSMDSQRHLRTSRTELITRRSLAGEEPARGTPIGFQMSFSKCA